MIHQKIQLLRQQIRQKNHSIHKDKIRFLCRIESNTDNEQVIEKILYLVAQCKFTHKATTPQKSLTSAEHSYAPLSQLICLINEKYMVRNWSAFILIYDQIRQLDLISLVCEQVGHRELICQFVSTLVMMDFDEILDKQYREVVLSAYYSMMTGSNKLKILSRLLTQTKKCFQQRGETDNFRILSCMIKLILQLRTQINIGVPKQNIKEDLNLLLIQLYCNSNLADLVYNFISLQTRGVEVGFQFIQFVNSVIGDKIQEKMQSSQRYSMISLQKLIETKQQIDYQILKALTQIYPSTSRKDLNIEVLLKIMLSLTPPQESCCRSFENFTDLLWFCMQSIQNLQPRPPFNLDLLMLKLLHRISFRCQWLCYATFDSWMQTLLSRTLSDEKSNRQAQTTSNYFNDMPVNYFYNGKSKYELDVYRNRENLIISILVNVIINQQTHACQSDYYEIMEQISSDLLSPSNPVLPYWCKNWRLTQNLQHLLVKLLNIKNRNMKKQLLQCSISLLKFKSVDRSLVKKIRLLSRLYDVDLQEQCEGFWGHEQQYEQEEQDGDYDDDQESFCSDL